MIELSSEYHREIAAHAERDYPYECCGLLLGDFGVEGTKIVREIHPISNAREEEHKRTRFLITPDEFRRGEQYAQSKGINVIGFYHSHPDHPAVPSEYDREHAWPTYSYVVAAIERGKPGPVRSWELDLDRSQFNEEEILKGK